MLTRVSRVEFDPVPASTLQSTADETHRQLNQTFLFGVTQRRRFARRSDNNNPGHATRDLRFDQMLERFKINFAASKRRYQRRECALKHWFRLHLRGGFPRVANAV